MGSVLCQYSVGACVAAFISLSASARSAGRHPAQPVAKHHGFGRADHRLRTRRTPGRPTQGATFNPPSSNGNGPL